MNVKIIFQNAKFQHWAKTLKYSLYVITHPMDGFWDLTHEKRGSIAAANTIMILLLLVSVWQLQFTSFIVNGDIRWDRVNIIKYLLGIVIPILVGCVANWSLTTLFDGKGTMRDIYMAIMYSLTPYVLIQIPLLLLSNLITVEELAFYQFFNILSLAWCVFLIMCAIMMIHDYGFSKAVLCAIATIVAMAVIIFIVLMFFSLISDAIAYFISLYKEITFRFY